MGVEVGTEIRIEPSCIEPVTSWPSVLKYVAGVSGQNFTFTVAPQHAASVATVSPISRSTPLGIAASGYRRSARTTSISRSASSGAGATSVLSNFGGSMMLTESGRPSESESVGSKLRHDRSYSSENVTPEISAPSESNVMGTETVCPGIADMSSGMVSDGLAGTGVAVGV